jgi:hypothetical protein
MIPKRLDSPERARFWIADCDYRGSAALFAEKLSFSVQLAFNLSRLRRPFGCGNSSLSSNPQSQIPHPNKKSARRNHPAGQGKETSSLVFIGQAFYKRPPGI